MAPRRVVFPELKDGTPAWAWLVTLVAGLSLLGVFVAGRLTREAVRDWERYAVAFSDIDCESPPGQERAAFLAEVQYLAGMPNQLSVLNEDLAARIAAAFARHPRVEKVEAVVIGPNRKLHVRLGFRPLINPGDFSRG